MTLPTLTLTLNYPIFLYLLCSYPNQTFFNFLALTLTLTLPKPEPPPPFFIFLCGSRHPAGGHASPDSHRHPQQDSHAHYEHYPFGYEQQVTSEWVDLLEEACCRARARLLNSGRARPTDLLGSVFVASHAGEGEGSSESGASSGSSGSSLVSSWDEAEWGDRGGGDHCLSLAEAHTLNEHCIPGFDAFFADED